MIYNKKKYTAIIYINAYLHPTPRFAHGQHFQKCQFTITQNRKFS